MSVVFSFSDLVQYKFDGSALLLSILPFADDILQLQGIVSEEIPDMIDLRLFDCHTIMATAECAMHFP